MTFEEFVSKVDETFVNNQAARSGGTISAANQWRYGQTIMNVLHDVWHKKYLEISDSDLDCFYDNAKVNILLDKLRVEWTTPQNSKSVQKRLEALQKLSDLDQELGLE